VKKQARIAYQRFRRNPSHPALHFKPITPHKDIYSVRIGLGYRALGTMPKSDEIIWFWIGTHAKYDSIIS